jgi:hypothetical protein
MELLANGIGADLGGQVATCRPLYVMGLGRTWYVNSATGDDAVNDGLHESRAFETLEQAHTACASGDVIVLADGFSQSVALTITKAVTIVGAGSSAGVPTATIRNSGAADHALLIDSPAVVLDGVLLEHTSATGLTFDLVQLVLVNDADFIMRGCHSRLQRIDGVDEPFAGVVFNNAEVAMTCENSTFEAVNTTRELGAGAGVMSAYGPNIGGLIRLPGCTFDGGAFGFAGYALDLESFNGRVDALGLSLLRGADVRLHENATGLINPQTSTGGSQVRFTPNSGIPV